MTLQETIRNIVNNPILGVQYDFAILDNAKARTLSPTNLFFAPVEPNKHYKKRIAEAQEELKFESLSACEAEHILDTAIRRKLNLADVGLSDLDLVFIAYRREGLFTYCYLKVVDEDTDSTFLKVGVTKRHAKEEENEDTAARVSLWRAVMAPGARIEHTPIFAD